MKNTKLLTLALGALIVFSSCEKTDLTVTLKQSGVLKIQLKNKKDEPVKNQKVKLYTYFSTTSSSTVLDSKTTDDNGNVDFGNLLQNTYYVVAKDVEIEGVRYTVSKPIQVVSGMTDGIVVNPEDYTGKITLKINMDNYINGSSSYLPVKKVNVALLEYKDYVDTLTYAQVLAKAKITAKTDDAGTVVFEKVPSNYEFIPFIYYGDTAFTWPNSLGSSIYVDKDDEITRTVYVLASKIMNIKATLTLTVQYYGSKGTAYGTWPVANASVIAVDNNTYFNYNLYSASLSQIKSKKYAEGKTSTTGIVKLKLGYNTSYYILVYYSDNYKYWVNSSTYIGNSNTSYYVDVDETALGLTK